MSAKRLLVYLTYLLLVIAAERIFDSWVAGAFVIAGYVCGSVLTFMREMERDAAQRTGPREAGEL